MSWASLRNYSWSENDKKDKKQENYNYSSIWNVDNIFLVEGLIYNTTKSPWMKIFTYLHTYVCMYVCALKFARFFLTEALEIRSDPDKLSLLKFFPT
jgi:hypothetical protein